MRRLTITIALLSLLFVGSVEAQTVATRYRCTSPTTGSIPTSYLWSVCIGDSTACAFQVATPDTFATIELPARQVAYVRVAARDALGRIGPISVASVVSDPGAPGGCGRPVKY
jgi:hypothetical protein